MRPDFNPNGVDLVLGSAAHWYDAACFSAPPAGAPASLSWIVVTGPHLVNTDLSLVKDTRIPTISEAFNVPFRVELLNIFNHTNFGYPTAGVFSLGASIEISVCILIDFQSNVSPGGPHYNNSRDGAPGFEDFVLGRNRGSDGTFQSK